MQRLSGYALYAIVVAPPVPENFIANTDGQIINNTDGQELEDT